MTDTTNSKSGLSRRTLLKTGAAAAGLAAGSGAITGFPTIWAQNIRITLRQFGTGVSNLNDVAEKCKEDLGITLEMTATRFRRRRPARRHPAGQLRHRRHRILDRQEGLSGRRDAADGRVRS